jgi:bifunctional DNase/RNase
MAAMSMATVRALAGLALPLSLAANAEQVKVESTEVRLSEMGPAVLLRVGNRAIPVFVDPVVAQSIQGALGGQKPVRPLSHDLMHSVLTGFGGRVSQVVITLHEGIYYGALTVVMGGKTKVFDSRSSDAIALAIHAGAPILVSRELLDQAGIELEAKK